jgi:hypothetical protein
MRASTPGRPRKTRGGIYSTVQKWDRSGNGLEPLLYGRRDQFHGITAADLALSEYPGVDPAPPGMVLLGDSNEAAVDERFPDRFAGGCEGRDFEDYVFAYSKAGTRYHKLPIDPFQSDVFAGGSRLYRMTLKSESIDLFQGIHTNGPLWSAVVFRVLLPVI